MPTFTEEQGSYTAPEGNDTTELYSRRWETKGTGTPLEDGDDQEECHSHQTRAREGGDDDGTVGFFGHFIVA